MRFRLNPLSPSGVTVVEETVISRSSPGYIGEVKISGLLTAGTNVTLTGDGTISSPYNISSASGSGGVTKGFVIAMAAAL